MSSVFRRTAVSAAVVALTIGAAAACGSSSSGGTPSGGSSSTPPASANIDSAAAALVPAALKSKGTLTIGVDSTYAPNEYLDTDGKTIVGWDIELFNAVAAKLGLKADYQTANFDSIITGVNAGKYDAGVSSFTINKMREGQSKMISYFSAGTQWAVKKGNPTGITPTTACGKHVAVQKATVEVQDLQARSKTCTTAGKAAIGIDQYTAQDAATEAVVAGKDDAVLADSPVMAYAVKQTNGALQLDGAIYGAAPYGYVVPKADADFAKAISMAVDDVIKDGSYNQVLTKWGVTPGAITSSAVNPPVSS